MYCVFSETKMTSSLKVLDVYLFCMWSVQYHKHAFHIIISTFVLNIANHQVYEGTRKIHKALVRPKTQALLQNAITVQTVGSSRFRRNLRHFTRTEACENDSIVATTHAQRGQEFRASERLAL